MTYSFKFSKIYILCLVVLALVSFSCKDRIDSAEVKQANLKADSLSIKLNSPELKSINVLILKEPGNSDLYYQRAKVYMSLHQSQEVVGDALRAIKLDSTKAEYYLVLADAYFAQN